MEIFRAKGRMGGKWNVCSRERDDQKQSFVVLTFMTVTDPDLTIQQDALECTTTPTSAISMRLTIRTASATLLLFRHPNLQTETRRPFTLLGVFSDCLCLG